MVRVLAPPELSVIIEVRTRTLVPLEADAVCSLPVALEDRVTDRRVGESSRTALEEEGELDVVVEEAADVAEAADDLAALVGWLLPPPFPISCNWNLSVVVSQQPSVGRFASQQ